jgi:replication factor C subunit 3/5
LPENDIINYLQKISCSENLNITHEMLSNIQKIYKSDMRSMINFLQSNQANNIPVYIIENTVWEKLIQKITEKENMKDVYKYVNEISITYNIDKKNIIKDFLNHIIRNHVEYISVDFLNFTENIIHSDSPNNNTHINYFITQLSKYLSVNIVERDTSIL